MRAVEALPKGVIFSGVVDTCRGECVRYGLLSNTVVEMAPGCGPVRCYGLNDAMMDPLLSNRLQEPLVGAVAL